MVKRYMVSNHGLYLDDELGDCVLYSDYAALEQQLADLKRRVKEARALMKIVPSGYTTSTAGAGAVPTQKVTVEYTNYILIADFDRILPESRE